MYRKIQIFFDWIIMEKIKMIYNIVSIIAIIMVFNMFGIIREKNNNIHRLENNIGVMSDSITVLNINDSTNATIISNYKNTMSEFKDKNKELYKQFKEADMKAQYYIGISYSYKTKIDSLFSQIKAFKYDSTTIFNDSYVSDSISIKTTSTVQILKDKKVKHSLSFDEIYFKHKLDIGVNDDNTVVIDGTSTTIDTITTTKINEKYRKINLGLGGYVGVGYEFFKKEPVYSVGLSVSLIPERLIFYRKRKKHE
jgi:hypothetical protein